MILLITEVKGLILVCILEFCSAVVNGFISFYGFRILLQVSRSNKVFSCTSDFFLMRLSIKLSRLYNFEYSIRFRFLLAGSSTPGLPRTSASTSVPNSSLMVQASTSGAPPAYSISTLAKVEEKDRKTNAIQILKLLCETPLLQVHLLDLLKARWDFKP